MLSRVEICHDRRDRRSCKICASCVNFSRNSAFSCEICLELQDLHSTSMMKCPKKGALLNCSSNDWVKLRKENSTYFPYKYQSFSGFQVFYWEKTDSLPENRVSAKCKNGRFSEILAGPRFVVNVGHFFGGPEGPTKCIIITSSNLGICQCRHAG